MQLDAHETTLTVVDPTADRTITLPNETGTLITSASVLQMHFLSHWQLRWDKLINSIKERKIWHYQQYQEQRE